MTPDERRPQDDEAGPAGRAGRPRRGSTWAPHCWSSQRLAERGERPGVGRRDPRRVEDLAAGPEVVREVDARQVRDQRRERPAAADGEDGPEPGEGHRAAAGSAARTPAGVRSSRPTSRSASSIE